MLYKKRTSLESMTNSDIFPAYPSIRHQQRVLISENITAHTKAFLREANKKRQEDAIISVGTLNCKIYVMTSPNGSPVSSEKDLNNFFFF